MTVKRARGGLSYIGVAALPFHGENFDWNAIIGRLGSSIYPYFFKGGIQNEEAMGDRLGLPEY